ncbi:MAG: sulfurtransferase [Deltaproteobacteria bacterium]|nr:sulfurtransferase [Deltaproteobacteria bacterium]
MSKILYSPNELHDLLIRGGAVPLDLRDPEDHAAGHIPAAVNVPDLFYYLTESTSSGLAKMHRRFEAVFSYAGLSPDKVAVFYEDGLDSRYGASCRGYWILTYLGHDRAGVLDGGLKAWMDRGFSVEEGDYIPQRAGFTANVRSSMMATKEDVLQAIGDSSVVLLDTRDEAEWLGLSSSPYGTNYTPRRGRIPGAKWIEWYAFMDRSLAIPVFKSAEEICRLCARQGIHPDDDIIIYCFKGARAANSYVALVRAGFSRLRVYFSSWNEWSRDLELPIEQD